MEIIKPIEAHLLEPLDRAVDEYGTNLINTLYYSVNRRGKLGELLAHRHTTWGTRIGLIGLGSIGGSHISDSTLSKTILVAGLVLCCGGAAELLYSYYLLNLTAVAQQKDFKKAELTTSVRDKMRMAIASQKEHRSKDQIVEQGARKFDQNDQKLEDHDEQLIAHSQKHVNQEEKIRDLEQVNKDQGLQMDEQKDEIDKQKNTIAAQQLDLDEQKSTIAKQRLDLDEQKSTIANQQLDLNEQKSKLTAQDKTIADLVGKFKAWEDSMTAKAS